MQTNPEGMCIIAVVNSGEPTGASSHFWGLMKYLPQHFNNLHVVLPYQTEKEMIFKHHFVDSPGNGKLGRVLLALCLNKKAIEICESKDISLVYTRSMINALLLRLKKKQGMKLILEMNGLWCEEHGGPVSGKILQMLEDHIVKKAALVVCVSNGIRDELLSRGHPNSKLVVVENGFDSDLFNPVEGAKEIVSERLGIPLKSGVAVFVGALYPWQGVDTAIESIKLVAAKDPDVVMLVVGDGEQRKHLQDMTTKAGLQKNVYFCGSIPHNKIPLFISAGDVCLTLKKPLKSGYSPLKLYEYMSCGKPVIATRVQGFEFIEEKRCGILVPPGDTKQAAEAVIRLLQNPGEAKDMGARGREYALEGHTWDDTARRIAEACRTLGERA